MSHTERLLLTAGELARLLNVSLRTLWRLRSSQRLPSPVRVGGTVRWRYDEIREWVHQGCPLETIRENESRKR